MGFDCLIRGGQAVLPTGVVAADVGIADGAIAAIGPELAGTSRETIDARGLHVFPGVVDTHVHFNEPGRSDWEGAATGSAALAAGGGVCFCDMPLNASPPTLDGPSFDVKRAALEAAAHVDFGLWGGLGPKNHDRLPELAERGVIGFKAFMCASGIDDFPSVNDEALGRGMEVAARLGLPVGVHAEDERLTSELARTAAAEGRRGVRDYLNSRPARAELAAIERAIALARQTGCSLHVVHVSCGAGVRAVVEARAAGVDVTCETCPHYLLLTADDVERIGAAAKCSPPVRDAAERDALWAGTANGDVDFLASDHSPAPWSMKQSDDFFAIWGGIAGCQTLLGLLLEEGHVRRGISLPRLADALSRMPAARFRLAQKGRLAVGADADLALLDMTRSTRLAAESLRYRHRISPFLGRALRGEVRRTLVRGQTVFGDGRVIESVRSRFVRPAALAVVGERGP
ncbi:MAG: allantoinase AllB [Pirellulales bacterium]